MGDSIYSRIVIATDDSENAMKAASVGINIAELTGAKVYALTVMPKTSPPFAVGSRATEWEMPYDVRKEEAENALVHATQMGQKRDVDVEEVILEGDAGEEIVNFAEKNNIDLIVVGTLGRGGIERFLMGSVAEKVVRHSTTQVLVVR